MKIKHLFQSISVSALLSLGVANAANATIYVPDYGDTGPQTYTYMFNQNFSGLVTIGVSDEDDTDLGSSLLLSDWGVQLSADGPNLVSTASYLNTLGESGTEGELYSFNFSALAGQSLSFSWAFHAADYNPFNDFAFVDIEGVHYEVLAEIDHVAVPVPAAAWLFGSGVAVLAGLGRRRQSV